MISNGDLSRDLIGSRIDHRNGIRVGRRHKKLRAVGGVVLFTSSQRQERKPGQREGNSEAAWASVDKPASRRRCEGADRNALAAVRPFMIGGIFHRGALSVEVLAYVPEGTGWSRPRVRGRASE